MLKSWIEITHPEADWVALAREAHGLTLAEEKEGKTKTSKRGAREG